MKHISYSINVRKIAGQNGVTLDEHTNNAGDIYFVVRWTNYADGNKTSYIQVEFSSQESATIYFNKVRG